jgi:hypothetical protein
MGYVPIDNKEEGIKTIYVGSRQLTDTTTGEVFDMEVIEKKISHKLKGGWRRVYLTDFMDVLGELYGRASKLNVTYWIINNLNSDNQLIYNQTQIAKKCNISRRIVNETINYLIKKNFLKKVGASYMVNPSFICSFGSDKKNFLLGIQYREES